MEISGDEDHQRILKRYGYDAWVWVCLLYTSLGALYIAESHAKDQSRWQKIKEKYMGGMFADFIVQIPALALAAVPYIAQIGA